MVNISQLFGWYIALGCYEQLGWPSLWLVSQDLATIHNAATYLRYSC